jgi:hypothetical protein
MDLHDGSVVDVRVAPFARKRGRVAARGFSQGLTPTSSVPAARGPTRRTARRESPGWCANCFGSRDHASAGNFAMCLVHAWDAARARNPRNAVGSYCAATSERTWDIQHANYPASAWRAGARRRYKKRDRFEGIRKRPAGRSLAGALRRIHDRVVHGFFGERPARCQKFGAVGKPRCD